MSPREAGFSVNMIISADGPPIVDLLDRTSGRSKTIQPDVTSPQDLATNSSRDLGRTARVLSGSNPSAC